MAVWRRCAKLGGAHEKRPSRFVELNTLNRFRARILTMHAITVHRLLLQLISTSLHAVTGPPGGPNSQAGRPAGRPEQRVMAVPKPLWVISRPPPLPQQNVHRVLTHDIAPRPARPKKKPIARRGCGGYSVPLAIVNTSDVRARNGRVAVSDRFTQPPGGPCRKGASALVSMVSLGDFDGRNPYPLPRALRRLA